MEDETAKATVEAKKCGVIQEEVTKIATDAQRDLDAAEPLVAKTTVPGSSTVFYSPCSTDHGQAQARHNDLSHRTRDLPTRHN